MIRRVCYSMLAIGFLTTCSTGWAARTVDRDYQLGDDPVEAPITAGVTQVGVNFTNVGGDRFTADSVFTDGVTFTDAQDLLVTDTPIYVDVSARPLLVSGIGVQFDGTDDALSGVRLNILEETAAAAGGSGSNLPAGFPFIYAGLRARGLQMWIKPDAAGLAANQRQTIIADTDESGGIAITADGKWTSIFDDEEDDGDIPGTVDAVADTWVHAMHHIYPAGDPGAPITVVGGESGFTGVLYIDGIAVSASNDEPDDGHTDGGQKIGVLTIGATELNQAPDPPPTDPVFGEFFDGTIDDIEMYVYGDNSDQTGGQDYGAFDLFSDNEWIANEVANTTSGVVTPGDLNFDGVVDIAGDVNTFVANWLNEKRIEGWGGKVSTVGDWETWGWGDFNLDGQVNLADWGILNAANPSAGAAALAAIGGSNVPEPSTVVLLSIGFLALAVGAKKRQLV